MAEAAIEAIANEVVLPELSYWKNCQDDAISMAATGALSNVFAALKLGRVLRRDESVDGVHVDEAAPAGEPGGTPAGARPLLDPRRPNVDPARIELIAECAKLIDNGLAPLVAAGLVHRHIATIVRADLRVALLESSGEDGRAGMELGRTQRAIAVASPYCFAEKGGA